MMMQGEKMADWQKTLQTDPVPVLLASINPAIVYFARRDLLDEKTEPIESVWGLPEPQKILKKQSGEGYWGKPGENPNVFPPNHDLLVETFKQFRMLVERYGFTREHPSIVIAAEFLFTFQTEQGDIRGFIGNQYATYYSGYVMSLLNKAGYGNDARIEKGIKWLLKMRQADGGWTIPLLTHQYDRETWLKLTSTNMTLLEPDRSKPFSHNWTDMVLRAFAAHPEHRKLKEAKTAGSLLKTRFFKPDVYTSMQSAKYWTRFVHWWPNLLTSLETLAQLGFTKDDPDIERGVGWFRKNQQKDGLWALEAGKEGKEKKLPEREWVGLRICRVLKEFYG